jgi:2-C-methyl-D-erythritol 4-phosphate cytidylyltransferase/2-C-methyl-D-erythritol 2,4-cyclodiphosphate synthase
MENRIFAAVIVAGGKGIRFGSKKQFEDYFGKPVVWHAIHAFMNHDLINKVVLVADDNEFVKELLFEFSSLLYCKGGNLRQDSVYAGLKALEDFCPTHVLIHDGARPNVDNEIISKVIDELENYDAVIPGIDLRDTVKEVTSGKVLKTLDRSNLKAIQTPQGFNYQKLLSLLEKTNETFTDESYLFEKYGYEVKVIEGNFSNKKITFNSDIPKKQEVRVGNGFDVHKTCSGNSLMLFGLKIDAGFSLIGHSDADVGLHSITDALLGCICDGDIGMHYSDRDHRWKNCSSEIFLKETISKIISKGGMIQHIDATLIAEYPKINNIRSDIRLRLSEIIKIDQNRISIKATTTEGLGFIGRNEGIAVQTTAVVVFK